MPKKIAVIVRENQTEGLRMAMGAIMLDDEIDVFVLDRKIAKNDDTNQYLEAFADFEMNLYSNLKEEEGATFLETNVIAQKLLDYDLIIPY